MASGRSERALIRDSGVLGVQSSRRVRSCSHESAIGAHSSDLSPAEEGVKQQNLQSDHHSSSGFNHSSRPLIAWLLFSTQTSNVRTYEQGLLSASSSNLLSLIRTLKIKHFVPPFPSKHHSASPCLCHLFVLVPVLVVLIFLRAASSSTGLSFLDRATVWHLKNLGIQHRPLQ